MSQVRRVGPGYVRALLTTNGTPVEPDSNGFVTLTAATYVFVLGGTADMPLESVHIVTDGTIAASSMSWETSNLPRTVGDPSSSTDDVTDWDVSTVGAWVKEDPTTAYVATVGTGWTVANMTVTAKTAGTGGLMLHVGNLGCKRFRLKVVCTTGGTMRVATHGKS